MSNWSPVKQQLIMIPAIVLKIIGESKRSHLIATYTGIASYYGSKNNKIVRPFPSHKALGERIGKSSEAVKKNIYELATLIDNNGLHLIEVKNRKATNKKENTSNEYFLPHYELIYLKGLQNHTPGSTLPDPQVSEYTPPRYSDTQYLNTLSKSNYPKYTDPNEDISMMQDLIKDLSNKKSL